MPAKFRIVVESDEDEPQAKKAASKAASKAAPKKGKEEVSDDEPVGKLTKKKPTVETAKKKPIVESDDDEKPKNKPKKKPIESDDEKPKKPDAKKSIGAHTCQHVIKGKDGVARICGKNAGREVNDEWFCGTENSGHYKSHLNAPSSASRSKTTGGKKAPAKSGAKKAPAKKEKERPTLPVMQRFLEQKCINATNVTVDGRKYAKSNAKNILFDMLDKDNIEAVGVLEKGKIRKLTRDECTWVEAYQHVVRKGCADEFSDSEDDEESADGTESSAESVDESASDEE